MIRRTPTRIEISAADIAELDEWRRKVSERMGCSVSVSPERRPAARRDLSPDTPAKKLARHEPLRVHPVPLDVSTLVPSGGGGGGGSDGGMVGGLVKAQPNTGVSDGGCPIV